MFKQITEAVSRAKNACFSFSSARYASNSTIFGLSSGFGKCGVSVIRVSGPYTREAIKLLTRVEPLPKITNETDNSKVIRPRFATLRKLWCPNTNDLIDKGLVLWFPGPHSFTGEDCCEFQVHGSIAVVSALCDALNKIDGLRPALAGEFTRRAFWSNKLDLTEVEGLADLIHAETEIQRKQALLQASGSLSKLYNGWRQRILRVIAHLEAYIDFAEDENIEPDTMDNVRNEVRKLITDIDSFLKDGRRGELRRHGVKTVILGEPNVGKSSFMNHMCQKPISIVASVAGTTRDVIETSFNIGGYPVVIADTAGLRQHTTDPIETEGIIRATNYAKHADLIILLMDARYLQSNRGSLDEVKRHYLTRIGVAADTNILSKEMIVIVNKIDLIDKVQTDDAANLELIFISCTEEIGISAALKRIEQRLKKLCGEPLASSPSLTNERHRHWMDKCLQHLKTFSAEFEAFNSVDDVINIDFAISAQQLREAIRCIGYITGSVNTEEILDVIFRDFCIGK